MITEKTKQQTDFIKMIANCLAKNFISSLFELTKEKSHSAQIGGLAEILDWSKEFCDQYYDKIFNQDLPKGNHQTIQSLNLDDLIVTFGREKLKKFYSEAVNHTNYFEKKYSAL